MKPLNARLYTSGGNMSMSSGVDISLTGFRLALRSPAVVDSPWADKAVALELLVTPPLDPVRRSESARVSLGSPRRLDSSLFQSGCLSSANIPRWFSVLLNALT